MTRTLGPTTVVVDPWVVGWTLGWLAWRLGTRGRSGTTRGSPGLGLA